MNNKLNDRLRELRSEKKISQAQLAKILGTTQDSISLWELNKREPSLVNLVKIAQYFNVSTDYLLGLTDF